MNPGQTPFAGTVEAYYRRQARIYDRTRWSFLFGRTALLHMAARHCTPRRILEVGCGTGHNLSRLRQLFANAELHGVDQSADMLRIARHKLGSKVHFWQQPYNKSLDPQRGFDLILASYSLSMFNPGCEPAIDALRADLRADGCLALVDFHDSGSALFKRWMAMNHVRMDGRLLPCIAAHLAPVESRLCRAYGGLWRYCLYIGRKSSTV